MDRMSSFFDSIDIVLVVDTLGHVDIVKAFDSVNREMLWEILSKYGGLPDSVIAVMKKMYTNIQIKLKIDDAEAEFTSIPG